MDGITERFATMAFGIFLCFCSIPVGVFLLFTWAVKISGYLTVCDNGVILYTELWVWASSQGMGFNCWVGWLGIPETNPPSQDREEADGMNGIDTPPVASDDSSSKQ